MKRFFSLCTLLLSAQATAVSITGVAQGKAPDNTRLSVWTVTAFGQPVEELASLPAKPGAFTLSLPAALPSSKALVPVDARITWPGLIDFQKASASAQAAELKLFTYRDVNGDGQRQSSEALKEVRAQVGKGELFMVWSTAPVTVTGSRSYVAELKQGWNILLVDLRGTERVTPVNDKTILKIDLE